MTDICQFCVLPGTSVGRTEFEDECVRQHIKVVKTTVSILSASMVSRLQLLSFARTRLSVSDCYVEA